MEEQEMKKKIIALLAMAMLTLATSAMATSLYVGTNYSNIHSVVNLGSGDQYTIEGGGSISGSSLDGRQLQYLYCVDTFNNINPGVTYPNTTINNSGQIHGIGLNNADKVAYLLTTYGTGGQTDQAIALQAAIWHEVNAPSVYKLDVAYYGSSSTIATLYNQYITAADNNHGDVTKFIWINPGNDATGSNVRYQGLVTAHNPEPSTIILLGTGILFMAVYGKRRMNKEA